MGEELTELFSIQGEGRGWAFYIGQGRSHRKSIRGDSVMRNGWGKALGGEENIVSDQAIVKKAKGRPSRQKGRLGQGGERASQKGIWKHVGEPQRGGQSLWRKNVEGGTEVFFFLVTRWKKKGKILPWGGDESRH